MDILSRDIVIGMNVYDSSREHIGVVDDFKYGEVDPVTGAEAATLEGADAPANTSIVAGLAEAFATDEIPDAVRTRLLHDGYIRIRSDGLFHADRYILPSQIASVSGEEIVLNVARGELQKRL